LSPQEEIEPLFKVENLQYYPMLDFMRQQEEISKSITALHKTKLLPSFNVGYNNTSIRGVGADNKSYTVLKDFRQCN
jgi:cobalt-zinc-cadmium resistance protein CzcA